MPAVEIADLLAELADVHPEAARQPGPVDVALLNPDLLVLERQINLGIGIRIERRLQRHLELAGHTVISLAAFARHEADIARGTDLRVEGRGIALAADELGLGWRRLRAVARLRLNRRGGRDAGRGGRSRTDGGEIIRGIRGGWRCRTGRRLCGGGPGGTARRPHGFEPAAQVLESG